VLKKTAKISAGICLLIIGLIGLLIPIMPQWPFIIPGLMLLAEYFPPAQRALDRLKPFVDKWKVGRKRTSATMEDRP
jgi:uncharacterized membrane protein YbaN (DUF454 family)